MERESYKITVDTLTLVGLIKLNTDRIRSGSRHQDFTDNELEYMREAWIELMNTVNDRTVLRDLQIE